MATNDGNNNMVDSKLADNEPKESDTVTSQFKQQGKPDPTDMEMADSQPVSEQVDPQTTAEQLESQHASSELFHPEPSSEDAIPLAPTNLVDNADEQMHIHSVTSKAIQSETYNAEDSQSHFVEPQPSSADVYSNPLNATEENNEMMNLKPAEEQPLESNNSLMVKSERVEPESMDMEEANLKPGEHEITELAHPEPLGEEVEYSAPVSSEQMHSHPEASENMHSQFVGPEILHPQAVTAELVHPHPVAADVVVPQSGNAELMYSQAGFSELVHLPHANLGPADLQPVAVELVNSHGQGAEIGNSHIIGMELVNMQQPLSTEITSTVQTTPETQPSKRRKKKSIVWEHFTIETVSAGCRRAYCKVCKQSFAYSTGSKVAGTSHLKRHIAKGTCPVVLRQQEKNQLSPYMPKSGGTDATTERQPKRRYRSSSSPYIIFDQDRCRQEIAKMIIMHDYPLHMVEHSGFVSFVQNLQPRFDMVSFNIVQGDCVAIFLREKQNLQRFIEGIPGRICLTLDLWPSSQSTGYVFVTGQFIDNDWKLHRRLLNVVMEPFPESDRALSHAIGTCLSDWGSDHKLTSITFNQPLAENALDHLRALLAVKNPMLLNGQLLIRSCIARTLSSMAQEVITAGEQTIKKIRTSVKYVKMSEAHEEKFIELKQQLRVPTEKSLSLDNTTKWNTTYEMLLAASELKQVFSCLDTYDPDYKDAPSNEDWMEVENILMYLKLFYDTATLLLAKPTPSSNVFFHEVWKIQLELARAAASDDIFVAGLAKPLQDRFHKYWKNSCLVLAVAVAMDPRFKMKLVEFSFTKIFMDEAPVYVRVVDEGIHELYNEYVTLPLPLTPLENNNGGEVKGEDSVNNNGLSDFDMYIMETSSQQMKSELDQYLEESLLPRVQDFDLLGWWKLNKLKYPTLSKMARDILSVPLSTVSPDAVFDTSSKEMDPYRCSLRPETLEALICAKDWLQPGSSIVSNEIVKMEL